MFILKSESDMIIVNRQKIEIIVRDFLIKFLSFIIKNKKLY